MKKYNIPKLKHGETKVVYQNPDFDEVFIFYKIEVPTSKKEFRKYIGRAAIHIL
jgi:hypothetical protein